MTNTEDAAFALSRSWANVVVAILILVAGLVFYIPYANDHIRADTFFSMRNLHDTSNILLAPVIAMTVMLFLHRRPLGRFIAITYFMLVVAEVATALVNDVLFSLFGYLDYEILPRVTIAVPSICIFTALMAVFVAGESIVREIVRRPRRRPASI